MALYAGIASYARPHAFKLCMMSLAKAGIIKGAIVSIDAPNPVHRDQYLKVIREARNMGLDIATNVSVKRRGSAAARNAMIELAKQVLKSDDILVFCDDDYVCLGVDSIVPIIPWLRNEDVGLVGGRVIDARKRRVDPDFHLNLMPGLADTLTRLTGFVFLDTKHGPRFVEYTTPLMATRINVLKRGVKYDPNYKGTGYREESHFQLQVRRLGYKIVYEPRFRALHLCIEEGGNRALSEATQRFYWKARNNYYFIKRNKLGMRKLIASTFIITLYAALNGIHALEAVTRGLRDARESLQHVSL